MRELKKVVIIQAGKNMFDGFAKKFLFTNITCPTIAAAIPENVNVEIIDMYVQNVDYNSINADLVLVTTLTTYAPVAFEVSRELRSRGMTVILGGVHAVVRPDECRQHFDAIVIGEAELLMDEILDDFRNDRLKERYETYEQMDLTKCRVPRYELLQLHKYSFCAIIASKGCAFDCDFCSSKLVTGAGFRHKSIEQIIDEIKLLQKLHEINPLVPGTFFFADSNLYTDRKFLIELLKALIPMDIHNWGMFASVNIAYDDEVLDLLEKANCDLIQIGFESVNLASLRGVNKKQNNPVKYKDVIENLAKRGINVHGSFIFGFDSDDGSVYKDTLTAIEEADFIMTEFFTLTPFPGTRIFEKLSQEGRILHHDWSKYDMNELVYKPKLMTADEMKLGLDFVRTRAADPERIIRCLKKFNFLSSRKPSLKVSEKIGLLLTHIFMYSKLKPGTRYFIRENIAKGNLGNYPHIIRLIARIQNP